MDKIWEKDYTPAEKLTEETLDENNSLKKMLRLIGENKRVLDFGCATGYFAQMLSQRGCTVTGIEINPDAAKVAEQYCQQVIVADLDLVSLSEILPTQEFDVAVFGDFLEHLRNPWKILEATKQLLTKEGCVVASVPNIAHGAIRLALLQGKFDYAEQGILDNTHLRFFTKKTIVELFDNAGYIVDTIDRTKIPIFASHPLVPSINKEDFDFNIIQQIEQGEETETLQFIVRAIPSTIEEKYQELKQRYSQMLEEFERSQSQVERDRANVEHLQSQLQQTETVQAQSQAELQQTQAKLEQSIQQLQQTEKAIVQLQTELQKNQIELEQSQSQLQQTQVELEQLQSQLQQTQPELEQLQSQLQQTQPELEQLQSQLQQTQPELEQSQSQLQQTQLELKRSQNQKTAMESSKFWKLRMVWFQFKQAFGLADTKIAKAIASGVTISECNDFKDIQFKVITQNSQNGVFDIINGSNPKVLDVRKNNDITASGWAILADEVRPADLVIITYGRDNIIVGVAAVNRERPDVAQALDDRAYENSGWSIKLEPANLPQAKITLKAWAYNSATKEAFQLNYSRSNSGSKSLAQRMKYAYAILKVKGMRYALAKVAKKISDRLNDSPLASELLPTVFHNLDPYHIWMSKHFPREADLQKMAETIELLNYKPSFSVIVPVYNPPEQFLREAIDSVINQVYPYWELCLADDASSQPHVRQVLEEYAAKDPRIKVVFREKNGHISRASNSAIEVATGEFIALLDHDDLLTPDALYEVAFLLNKHPDADMIYSDEDKVSEHNQLKDPFFKPDWCPDSFLSRMYTCHLGIYRRSLINEIEGFRVGYEGSQDYDLVLRFTEKTEKIFHIPKILYHWRIHSQSAASGSEAKPYAYIAAEKALADALTRRGEQGIVSGVTGFPGLYSVRYKIQDYKLVSIIIPTKNLGQTLEKCLNSIFQKTEYPKYEVIVIDNGSTEECTAKVINFWTNRETERFKCYQLDIPFNFSRINNYAVNKAKGDYLLFLNNDTEVISSDWIDAMVEQAQRASVGSVGGLLLYPDRTIQHAGVVLGIGGVASHSHKHFYCDSPGYFGQVVTINNYSAVTAACLMCRREVYESIGGFDEDLAVAYNDIDFCLKLAEKKLRNIYLPHVVLHHYESKSRGVEDNYEKLKRLNEEADYMKKKWQNLLENDPCYSPHLTRNGDDYSIRI